MRWKEPKLAALLNVKSLITIELINENKIMMIVIIISLNDLLKNIEVNFEKLQKLFENSFKFLNKIHFS